jgi:hypothetical protein
MKQKLTFEKFRQSTKTLDKTIRQETAKHDNFRKHFELLLLKRKNYLLQNGIETEHDRLGVCK